jgi:hypothetical protein
MRKLPLVTLTILMLFQYAALADEAAIARCSATGKVAVGRGADAEQAAAAAVTNCIAKGGQLVCCRELISTSQGRCIALAIGETSIGVGAGQTRNQAIEEADANCENEECQIAASPCK